MSVTLFNDKNLPLELMPNAMAFDEDKNPKF
jgi:hypothetical protein